MARKRPTIADLRARKGQGQLTMLRERNVIERPGDNALITVLHVTPTSLDEGLRHHAVAIRPQGGVFHRIRRERQRALGALE